MICPKCSREMSSEASVCDYCGFTFQTPKNSAGTAPYAKTPFIPTAPAAFSDGAAQGSHPGGRTTVQMPPPPVYTGGPTPYSFYAQRTNSEPLSIGQYIGMILLTLIPVVGLIVMIVWAASRNINPNRRHFAGAVLILKALNLLLLLGAFVFLLLYNTPLFFYIFP